MRWQPPSLFVLHGPFCQVWLGNLDPVGADWPDVSNILITRHPLLRRRARRRAYAFQLLAHPPLFPFLHVSFCLSSQHLIALDHEGKKNGLTLS
jgi:hypothetical protein